MVKPNAQGTEAVLVARYDYDVYGAVRTQSGSSSNKFKYVASIGHPTDEETGLIYMRARYYEPGVGRFISEDPGKHRINWFIYADNSPTGRIDPNGKESLAETEEAVSDGMAAEGGGGTITLWRGVSPQQLQQIIDNGYKFLVGEDKLFFSLFQKTARAFAIMKKGTLVSITIDAEAFNTMVASGLISIEGGGFAVVVPPSVIGYINTLYVAVQLVEHF
jgi:RHS repeat-associated protein